MRGELTIVIVWEIGEIEIKLNDKRYQEILKGLDSLDYKYRIEEVKNQRFINLQKKPSEDLYLLVNPSIILKADQLIAIAI